MLVEVSWVKEVWEYLGGMREMGTFIMVLWRSGGEAGGAEDGGV